MYFIKPSNIYTTTKYGCESFSGISLLYIYSIFDSWGDYSIDSRAHMGSVCMCVKDEKINITIIT